MEHIFCELCDDDDYEILVSDGKGLSGPLVRCRQCGLAYVNPRDTQFAVDENATNSSGKRVAVWKHYAQIWDESLVPGSQEFRHSRSNFKLRVKKIQEYLTEGFLLDVGCGQGHFLSVARDAGFRVIGIEPNEETAQFARRVYGLEVIAGVLPHSDFGESEFDLVTMLHVVEHLPFPGRELMKVSQILKSGGFLFIEVPNIDVIWFRLLGSRWRQIIPDHYFFFSPKTLQSMLEKQGFRVNETSMIGKRMSLHFFLSRLSRYNKLLASLLVRLAEKGNVLDREIYVNLGDVMFVVAQKE